MLQEKGKKAKSYINLQKNLMSKFDEVTVLEPKSQEVDELGFLISEEMYNNQQNNVNDLIQRAKNLTLKNQAKINKAKKSLQIQKKNTFLTGVNIPQQKIELQIDDFEPETEDVGEVSLLNEVVSIKTDDLDELMKMIKQTGSKINNCGRDLGKAKLEVMDAADRFGRPMNNRIASNIDKYPQLLQKMENKPPAPHKIKFSKTARGKLQKLM